MSTLSNDQTAIKEAVIAAIKEAVVAVLNDVVAEIWQQKIGAVNTSARALSDEMEALTASAQAAMSGTEKLASVLRIADLEKRLQATEDLLRAAKNGQETLQTAFSSDIAAANKRCAQMAATLQAVVKILETPTRSHAKLHDALLCLCSGDHEDALVVHDAQIRVEGTIAGLKEAGALCTTWAENRTGIGAIQGQSAAVTLRRVALAFETHAAELEKRMK